MIQIIGAKAKFAVLGPVTGTSTPAEKWMYICDHRYRHFHTLEGPVELVCKLNHCPDPHCAGHTVTKSPEIEASIAPPHWAIGWDVFCWIGHRRCSRHRAIPRIRAELLDSYRIALSDDAIGQYIHRYQVMVAARQQDPVALLRQYRAVDEIILSIDGLQPEKGHETLYVVRELTQERVWFAEAPISATADEVRRLIAKPRGWAEALGKPVGLWLSDRQDAFVTGIAAEFPGVPHRYCQDHFLRDVAKPVSEIDSPIQEGTADTPGRLGAALSGIVGVLALSRAVVFLAHFGPTTPKPLGRVTVHP